MKALAVHRIFQKDNHTFTIEWSDGVVQDYRLSELQKRCPCANCVDEGSGQRLSEPSMISDDLKAKRIMSVGRYALRVDFTTGCSSGIYDFDMLKKMEAVL